MKVIMITLIVSMKIIKMMMFKTNDISDYNKYN